MMVLWFARTVAAASFDQAQTAAIVVAMTVNFFLNNLYVVSSVFTWRQKSDPQLIAATWNRTERVNHRQREALSKMGLYGHPNVRI
jgi:putative flippase GtrA